MPALSTLGGASVKDFRRNQTPPSNGLFLFLDASNLSSYPGSGSVWYDLSGRQNHMNIVSSAWASGTPAYMNFNGSYGCAKSASGSDIHISGNITAIVWCIPLNSTGNWRTLFRGLSGSQNHQVIFQAGSWAVGMYDNDHGTGFNNSGYSQQSLPGYPNSWVMMTWQFSTSSPQYQLSINGSPSSIVGSISSSNATFNDGICSLGAYNNGDFNPANASQYFGLISQCAIYQRNLNNDEILQYFTATRGRFGV